ncbi:MAG: hypothetical protein V9G13_08495 [Marmoricola sp.]
MPIVTAGAGDTVWVFSDGHTDREGASISTTRLRLKGLPDLAWPLPWGLNLGVAGFAPYSAITLLALSTKSARPQCTRLPERVDPKISPTGSKQPCKQALDAL